jgi:signal transduction histidine kinase
VNTRASLKAQMKSSILKQSAVGGVAIAVVLFVVAFVVGKYQAAVNLQEIALSTAKAYRSQILEGDIKTIESQMTDLLKLEPAEVAVVLGVNLRPIYSNSERAAPEITCRKISEPCVSLWSKESEILVPIFFDQDGKSLFGYLFFKRNLHLDWLFLSVVFSIFGLGYAAVFFGVTRITKSTMLVLANSLEDWAARLSQDPKNVSLLATTPYQELVPLKCAIEGLNKKIARYESNAAEKAKLLILRGIAHDLEGPLAQAKLYLGALKKKAEDLPEFVSFVKSTADSIDDVLQVASQVKLLKEMPQINDAVDLGIETKRELDGLRRLKSVAEKNIAIDLDVEGGSPVVPLSRPDLKRILQNLVQNSADASPVNSKIEIQVRRAGAFGVLSVRDHGHGIAKEHLEKVFQPDFTLKPGTGTGLGLAVVNHIAAIRNGSITLESSPNGTRFDLSFPVKEGIQNG